MTRAIQITSEADTALALGDMRREAGMRQSDLAAKVHISLSAIRDREHGRRGINAQALIDTANAAGFDVVLVPRQSEEQP